MIGSLILSCIYKLSSEGVSLLGDKNIHTTRSFVALFICCPAPRAVTALNDLTLLFSAPDSASRVSTLEKDKSSMSSVSGSGAGLGRSSMSSVVGLTSGLASAAKQQRSEHHSAANTNNGRSPSRSHSQAVLVLNSPVHF